MEEKQKKQLEQVAQSGSFETIIGPSSPIRRHMKLKMVRTKISGQMKYEVKHQIADRIVS